MDGAMLEPPNIPADLLRACLQDAYGIAPITVEFLPLGLDTRAGVYRVVSAEGTVYLLKAKWGSLYEASCQVPRALRDQDIAAVVAPLPTRDNALWTPAGEWTLILYPFIEGVVGNWQDGLTDGQWRAVGAALRQIHDVAMPANGMGSVRAETFDASSYARQIQMMTAHFATVAGGDQYARSLRALWLAHQLTIDAAMATMLVLTAALQENAEPYVICHADLHASNIIRADNATVFLIDWDDVMLAPKERDFLFVGEPPTDAPSSDGAPFFQGYGLSAIDWTALTYYRWERIITDVIECAESVCFRDDVAEVTRAREAQLFQDILAAGNGMIVAAQRAAMHLSPDLTARIAHRISMASPKL
jgi:spectinomycin phosphotransferase